MALSEEKKAKLLEIEAGLGEHPFPPQVIIEVTSRCNFECRHCAHKSMKRENADMPAALFNKIIDEIAERAPETEVWPAFYGESLLLGERLFDYIKYAKEKGCNNIFLNTNGSMLRHERIREGILESGIKCLIVSLDAFSKETFNKIRRGGDREQIYRNVESLIIEKERRGVKHPAIICQFVVMDENRHEAGLFRNYWLGKGAGVKFRDTGSWTGAVKDVQLDYEDDFRIACPIGNNTLAIHENGNVVACCADYEGGFIAGNVRDSSIEGIWKTVLYEKIRRPSREHRWSELPVVCQLCRDWQICGAEYISGNEKDKSVYPFWYKGKQ
jgi:radical SAM protein with 4Fe4S-binding SPASM domain